MERTWKPTAAGIICIIAGALFVVPGIVVSIALSSDPSYMVLGALVIIPGIMPILGGIYALRRRRWRLALTGSIFTLLSCVILGMFGIITFLGAYADNYSVIPPGATSEEALAVIFSDPVIIGFIVGVPISGILGMLALIFVIQGKREFK